MKNVLLPRQAEVLSRLTRARPLLAFDFDGTLAPIVRGRHEAGMRPETCALFSRLCQLFPTAVISGRARADVATRLDRAKVKYLVGNHGIEGGARSATRAADLDEARERLALLVAKTPGLELEDKGLSLTVHYRRSRHPAAAQRSILRVLGTLTRPLRAIGGKSVINVVPPDAPDKGDAMLELCARSRAEVALYVGDDVTDEDVFELHQPERLICIRVGRSTSSAADYFLPSQREIDGLLQRLIALKQGAP